MKNPFKIFIFLVILITGIGFLGSNLTANYSNFDVSQNVDVPNKNKLDLFLNRVLEARQEFTSEQNYLVFVSKVEDRLSTLRSNYSSNQEINNMLNYLETGVVRIRNISNQNNDLDDFFCDLFGDCNGETSEGNDSNSGSNNPGDDSGDENNSNTGNNSNDGGVSNSDDSEKICRVKGTDGMTKKSDMLGKVDCLRFCDDTDLFGDQQKKSCQWDGENIRVYKIGDGDTSGDSGKTCRITFDDVGYNFGAATNSQCLTFCSSYYSKATIKSRDYVCEFGGSAIKTFKAGGTSSDNSSNNGGDSNSEDSEKICRVKGTDGMTKRSDMLGKVDCLRFCDDTDLFGNNVKKSCNWNSEIIKVYKVDNSSSGDSSNDSSGGSSGSSSKTCRMSFDDVSYGFGPQPNMSSCVNKCNDYHADARKSQDYNCEFGGSSIKYYAVGSGSSTPTVSSCPASYIDGFSIGKGSVSGDTTRFASKQENITGGKIINRQGFVCKNNGAWSKTGSESTEVDCNSGYEKSGNSCSKKQETARADTTLNCSIARDQIGNMYYNAGRCPDNSGYNYWKSQLSGSDIGTISGHFRAGLIKDCMEKTGTSNLSQCFDKMFCPSGFSYQRNSTTCVK